MPFPLGPTVPLPLVPHEAHPDAWPQPDYFAEALRVTGARADQAYASVSLRRQAGQGDVEYIVLPVQTQAFAFGAAFRALAGAELDRQLAASGVPATDQTDVVGVTGPYVRRLDDAVVREFVAEHPRQNVLTLFVGHDGIDHAFVDLKVERGPAVRAAHRTIDLPEGSMPALDAVAKAMSEMLGELHVTGAAVAKKRTAPPDFVCTSKAWDFGWVAPVDQGARACLALAVGSLLPTYDIESIALGEMPTASRLAWLAQAYVLAAAAAADSPSAAHIRDLSLRQLGLSTAVASTAGEAPSDAVTSRVSTLLALDHVDAAPVRSPRDRRDQLIAAAGKGLPDFAAALFVARGDYEEPFSRTDFCLIAESFPSMSMPRGCEQRSGPTANGPLRAASQAEILLYQEWRIAAAFKDLASDGITQGRVDVARASFTALPADVAGHPFMQRLRSAFSTHGAAPRGETFDGRLARLRTEMQGFVQSTVDLQRNDQWMAAHSLSGHTGARNFNIDNDPQVRAQYNLEARLLAVMVFDRFEARQPAYRFARRQAGEPAFFLLATLPPWIGQLPTGRFLAASGPMPMSMPVSPQAGAPIAPPAPPPVFQAFAVNSFGLAPADLDSRLRQHPESMALRSRLAIARLKEGVPVADVVKLFEAQPADARTDNAVGQSFLWALPAHVLFLAGELQASKPFYERVVTIGSGSESVLQARVRVALIDGKLDAATAAAKARLDRYDSEFARRDLVGLLFVQGKGDAAWPLFLEKAQTASLLEGWDAAALGHRQQKLGLADIQRWLSDQQFGRVQIVNTDVTGLYLHRMAVTDRLPSEADIALLQSLPGSPPVAVRWTISAVLAAGALGNADPKAVLARFKALSSGLRYDIDHAFMLPLYAWIAGQAGEDADPPTMTDVAKVPIDSDFNHLLAKTLWLAARGDVPEALRYLRAAHYELAQLTWGDNGLSGRAVLPQYEYARAVFLMYRRTGNVAFRNDALSFARSAKRAWPYLPWSYALEAATETEPHKALLARCRATALDPGSYFLQEALRAQPRRMDKCPKNLW